MTPAVRSRFPDVLSKIQQSHPEEETEDRTIEASIAHEKKELSDAATPESPKGNDVLHTLYMSDHKHSNNHPQDTGDYSTFIDHLQDNNDTNSQENTKKMEKIRLYQSIIFDRIAGKAKNFTEKSALSIAKVAVEENLSIQEVKKRIEALVHLAERKSQNNGIPIKNIVGYAIKLMREFDETMEMKGLTKFHNFTQREYDFDEMERKLLLSQNNLDDIRNEGQENESIGERLSAENLEQLTEEEKEFLGIT